MQTKKICKMEKSTKEKIALGLGLIAGGALGYWLNSDKGREVRSEAADKANEYGRKAKEQADQISENLNRQAGELSTKLNDQANRLSTNLNQAYEQSRDYLSKTGDTLKTQFQRTASNVEGASEDFQAGINYAIDNIQRKARELSKQNGSR